MREIKINGIYKHFKNINVKVICIAKDSETLDEMVVYKHLDTNEIWIRKLDEFLSEVDHKKYPQVEQKYRFELIE